MKRIFLTLLVLCLPAMAHAQGGTGFFLVGPGQQWANCINIPNPQTNLTWCGDGNNGPAYTWKVWDGATYVTITGGGGGGAVALNNQTWAAFPSQFFSNDVNFTMTSSGGVHTLGMTGCLGVSRGGLGICAGTANAVPYFDTPGSVAMSGITWTAPNVLTLGPLSWTLVDGTAGQVLTTNGAGVLSFGAAGSGTTTGTGVANQIAVWSAASNLTGFTDFLWDEANQNLTVSFGNTIAGLGSVFIIGDSNTTIGANTYILGHDNTDGTGNTYIGKNNDLTGSDSAGAVGADNNLSSGCGNCWAFGDANTLDGGTVIAVGNSNSGSSGSSFLAGLTNTDSGGGSNVTIGSGNTNTNSDTMLVGYNLNSILDSSLSLGMSADPEMTITSNLVQLGANGAPTVELLFYGSTSGYAGFAAPATVTTAYHCYLPTNPGNNGDVLSTDGATPCNLSWIPPGGGGAGITSLNGIAAAVQTVAAGSTNINWSSAVSTHTFTWTGQLSAARGGTGQDTSAWSALPLVTAGVWSQFAGSTCGGGQSATAIGADGTLTCAATGTGSVTHTAGALTLNQVVVGNGGADVRAFGGADTGVFFASTGGQLSQDTAKFGYDSSKSTLKLGFGGVFATEPWGSPPLLASPSAEIGFATGATGPKLTLTSSNGTLLAPTASAVGNVLGTVEFKGYDGTNGVQGARIYTTVAAALSSGIIPTNIVFETTNVTGVKQTALVLRNNGNVVLGHKLAGYGGLGATNGSLLIGNSANQTWEANTLVAGPGITISNGPGTIQIATVGAPGNCAGGGRVVLTDAATDAVVTFAVPMANATYAMASSAIPGVGATPGIPAYVKDVTVNGFTVVLTNPPGIGKTTTVAWIATPSTCIF